MKANTTAEHKEERALLYALFDKWTDTLQADDQETADLVKEFSQIWEVAETSPLALMFEAFVGGVKEGMNLSDALEGKFTD